MPFSSSGLHGAYRRVDLLRECGRRRFDDALRRGVLQALWPGVVVEGDRALDVRTRSAAALMTTNAAAETHVLLPYGRSPRERPGLVIHHSAAFARRGYTW